MMIKGNNPENIRVGSTLSTDEFAGTTFDFMLSNPPYGKSWSSEQKYIKDGKEVIDPRFKIKLANYWGVKEEVDAIPRSSDGQLLFLMEMISKMKSLTQSPTGSRIASVHNGSSLFTGDAGGGESNIRRYIIENDWLDAIIQLPNNLFYNTGITTYIWILTNNKAAHRKGKVQLIDASKLYKKLRKNLGNKNCEFTPEHITQIVTAYTEMASSSTSDAKNTKAEVLETEVLETEVLETEVLEAKVFDNSDFGYYKATIERPKRLKAQFTEARIEEKLRFDKTLREPMEWAYKTFGDDIYTNIKAYEKQLLDWCETQELNLSSSNRRKLTKPETWKKHLNLVTFAKLLWNALGEEVYADFNLFKEVVNTEIKKQKLALSGSDKKAILNAVSWYDAEAEKVIKRIEKFLKEDLEKLLAHLNCTEEQLADFGYYSYDAVIARSEATRQSQPPKNTKGWFVTYDTESDLRDTENVPLKDTIYNYFKREVQPHVAEAWINLNATKIGYEISFNKYFYKHIPLRSIKEVTQDILDLEQQSDGLIAEILNLS
jgi:type I restriction enzyme M protein